MKPSYIAALSSLGVSILAVLAMAKRLDPTMAISAILACVMATLYPKPQQDGQADGRLSLLPTVLGVLAAIAFAGLKLVNIETCVAFIAALASGQVPPKLAFSPWSLFMKEEPAKEETEKLAGRYH